MSFIVKQEQAYLREIERALGIKLKGSSVDSAINNESLWLGVKPEIVQAIAAWHVQHASTGSSSH